MKTKLVSMLLLVIVTLLAGCYAPASRISKVQIGMTEADVQKIMGPPISVTADQESKSLNYSLSEGTDTAHGVPYTVRLVNGKVISYGRDGTPAPRTGPTVTPILIH